MWYQVPEPVTKEQVITESDTLSESISYNNNKNKNERRKRRRKKYLITMPSIHIGIHQRFVHAHKRWIIVCKHCNASTKLLFLFHFFWKDNRNIDERRFYRFFNIFSTFEELKCHKYAWKRCRWPYNHLVTVI